MPEISDAWEVEKYGWIICLNGTIVGTKKKKDAASPKGRTSSTCSPVKIYNWNSSGPKVPYHTNVEQESNGMHLTAAVNSFGILVLVIFVFQSITVVKNMS